MRTATILIFLISFWNSYSQTGIDDDKNTEQELKETIDWLNQKIQEYQFDGHFKVEYDLTLEKENGDYFIKILNDFYLFREELTSKSISSIPIKEISEISFRKRGDESSTEDRKGYILKISIINNNHKIREKKTTYFRGEKTENENKNYYIINFERSIDSENLKERINKAFDYLKELTQNKGKEKF